MSLVLEDKKVRIVGNNVFYGMEGNLKYVDNDNNVIEVEINRNDGTVFTYRGKIEDIEEI